MIATLLFRFFEKYNLNPLQKYGSYILVQNQSIDDLKSGNLIIMNYYYNTQGLH